MREGANFSPPIGLQNPKINLCVAISAATYRGAKFPTLKTAEKQPKRDPSGSR